MIVYSKKIVASSIISFLTMASIEVGAQDSIVRPIDKILQKHLGVYNSIEACHVIMPRFTDIDGPSFELKILAYNEYRSSIDGSQENDYFVQFDYREDFSGQEPEVNHHTGYAKITSATSNGNSTLLNLESISCSEYFDQDEEFHPSNEFSQKFQMRIELLPDEKIKLSTINPPSTCALCWKFNDVILFPLLWSKSYNE
jgi:hypothetical protein